jgi:ribonuclease P protein component
LRTKKSPISEPRLDRPESGNRFRRQEHLKRRVEITRVFKKGRAVVCPGAKLFFLVNGMSHNRIVITFARKYGNAVRRNRARRTSREAYRLMKKELRTGYDLVLLIYPRPAGLSGVSGPDNPAEPDLAESARRFKTLFRKAGIG